MLNNYKYYIFSNETNLNLKEEDIVNLQNNTYIIPEKNLLKLIDKYNLDIDCISSLDVYFAKNKCYFETLINDEWDKMIHDEQSIFTDIYLNYLLEYESFIKNNIEVIILNVITKINKINITELKEASKDMFIKLLISECENFIKENLNIGLPYKKYKNTKL